MTEYDAVVYDLDGTLVDLDVDWAAVRAACREQFRERGVDQTHGDLWDLLDIAADHGFYEAVEDTIAEFECAGARTSRRLPLAEEVPQWAPVGVCSLNAEDAVRIALETHELTDHVGAVVGRGTVETTKPDPEPLLETIDRLGAAPERTLFVGDSDSDAEAARRAGTDFQYVRERV